VPLLRGLKTVEAVVATAECVPFVRLGVLPTLSAAEYQSRISKCDAERWQEVSSSFPCSGVSSSMLSLWRSHECLRRAKSGSWSCRSTSSLRAFMISARAPGP